jgi:PAS domain S-box-containing protein
VIEQPEIKFITVRLLRKDGTWVWCMVRGHNLLRSPHINSIVVYFHDDTLRKQAKDALKESEKRFRFLIRDLQVGVFLSDENFRIIMCNTALAAMLSLPEKMIVGKNIYEVMPNDMINENGQSVPLHERPLSRTLRSKQSVKGAVMGVLNPLTKERSWIMVNADPIMNEEGKLKHLVCSVMDITERKKLEQKIVTEQISHQRQLTQATIDGQENERREIGKELHDNIGQQLTTIKLFLDLAKSTADDATHEMVNMAVKGVSEVINEIRAMSRSLIPSTLKDLGLVDSIHELAESFLRTQSLKIEFEYAGFDEELIPENQKLTLFRITQEQLNNIVKHAGAKKVWIKLHRNAEELFLEIRDDGNGFDIKKTRQGLGFVNMRNRAELFGGKAEVLSASGKGCLLKISFPHNLLQSSGLLNSSFN